ncbi:MAG: peroxide stress protein YaaA [Firmicutes bacterium]|nr:peroxide stress protein YaaA [Bacillota bacterium]
MKIILSPAKQMVYSELAPAPLTEPVFLQQAEQLKGCIQTLSLQQAQKLWGCSDRLAAQAYGYFQEMDLARSVSPAILSYDGIAFKYMAPSVFEQNQFDYLSRHLVILSGFYGCLRPMDGIVPYRLEMQAKGDFCGCRDLYSFWGDRLCRYVCDDPDGTTVVDLASKEYSRCIEKHLLPRDRMVTVTFAEMAGERLVQKGVYCKMARGEMVRYMAENAIEDPKDIIGFDRLGYRFAPAYSSENELVFLRDPKQENQ